MQHFRPILTLVSLTTSFWVFQSLQATAQIIPDNSLGVESSVVVPNVEINGINSDRIDGGAVRESNLFHSFQEFNIDNGRGAYFSNPESIVNILTRVTGNNISNIFGTLGVLGNANLFLINPNGIVFGPNVRLDVSGSFFASTADSILFENGVEFAASNPDAPPLLTINIPIGLNFRENPGNIVNQAALTTTEEGDLLRDNAGFLIPQGLNVPQNQTLALVGGNILFDNGVAISPGSNIELGGLSEPGLVEFKADGSLTFPSNTQLGDITLTNESQINVRADEGGRININSQNFTLSNESIIRGGIDQDLGTLDSVTGDININSHDIFSINGNSFIANSVDRGGIGTTGRTNINANQIILSHGRIFSNILGQGNGGDINIIAESFIMDQQARISNALDGQGNSGIINIQVSDVMELSDPGTAIFGGSFAEGIGQGGEVQITTGSLSLTDGVLIDTGTWGIANGGDITINATEPIVLTGTNEIVSSVGSPKHLDAMGDGGNITITAPALTLRNGSEIGSTLYGEGNLGKITINTTEFVELDGVGIQTNTDASESTVRSAIGNNINLLSQAPGNAGYIEINTGNLIIRNGAEISNITSAQENAGSIRIQARSVEIKDTVTETLLDSERFSVPIISQISNITAGEGDTGEISVITETLSLQNGGQISVQSAGEGSTGDLIVQARYIEIIGTTPNGVSPSQLENFVTDLSLESELLPVGTGNAGNIIVETDRLVMRAGGQIRSQNSGSPGSAGKIEVRANDIELTGVSVPVEETQFSLWPSGFSTSSNIGSAGNIFIETQSLTLREGALITTATLDTSNSGNIFIKAEQININGTGSVPSLFPRGIFSGTFTSGDGGNITIETNHLNVAGGASISAGTEGSEDNTFPVSGRGGTIKIQATDAINLVGVGEAFNSQEQLQPTNISSSVRLGTSGSGGNVLIKTGRLTVEDGAEISVATESLGDAGSIEIDANLIEIIGVNEESQFPSRLSAAVTEEAVGQGGTIQLNTEQIRVENGAEVTVNSAGIGDPGNLQVTTTDLLLNNQARFSAESATGQGGNIQVNSDAVQLRRQSEISAIGSESGTTQEGNINLNTDLLLLLEQSQIITNALNPSGGSNINIQPFNDSNVVIIQSTDSVINAAGNLTIDSSVTFQPAEIPEVAVTNPNDLIAAEFCRQRGISQFTITGRGGIAVNPNDKSDGNQIEVDLVEPIPFQPRNTFQKPAEINQNQAISSVIPSVVEGLDIIPARGWIRDENGDVILVSYDPTKIGTNRQPAQHPQCQS